MLLFWEANLDLEMRLDVLIVDDELQVLRMCKSVLQKQTDYKVETASDSTTAVDMVKNYNPRLVLMDIHLSDSDLCSGVECVSKLREIGYKGLICMMTGDASIEKVVQAVVAGADNYFKKNQRIRFADEISSLLAAKKPVEQQKNKPLPRDSVFLRSLNLERQQIDMLLKWHDSNFVTIKEFSKQNEIANSKVSMRFLRIREKLGIDNMHQLAHLLGTIAMFEAPRRF